MEIIAELGWNFMGDMDLAKEMILNAKKSGANIVKFQYWDPNYLSKGSWDNDGRRDIYNKAALDDNKIEVLSDFCSENKIECLFSVFNLTGAKKMKLLGERSIKIPSHEIANLDLIQYSVDNFDRIYISAGACTKEELQKVVSIVKNAESEDKVCLMHCVSSYPVDDSNANLGRILYLSKFGIEVGYSDHTQSLVIPSASVMFGSTVLEKHFTSNKDLPGRDNKFALNAKEFSEMVSNVNAVMKALNDKGVDYQDIERDTVENYRGRWGK